MKCTTRYYAMVYACRLQPVITRKITIHNLQQKGKDSHFSAWHLVHIKAQSKGKIVLMNQKVKSMPSYSISKELIKRASQHPNC